MRAPWEKVRLKGESTGGQVRHEPLHGELAKEGDADKKEARRRRGELWEEEVGKSNDKFLGPRVPGVAGDNSRV